MREGRAGNSSALLYAIILKNMLVGYNGHVYVYTYPIAYGVQQATTKWIFHHHQLGKKIIVSICVIDLMLVSSGVSVNAFDKGELFMELETEGNTLITEYGDQRVIEINSAGSIVAKGWIE